MEDWTTKEIVGTIIATGLVSAIFTTAMGWIGSAFSSWRRTRQERSYLASRVAAALENYAAQCSSLWGNVGSEYDRYQEVSSSSLPRPPQFPADADWRCMKVGLAYKVLTFLNEIEAEDRYAKFARHFENNPFQVASGARDSGERALALASEVRRSINLKIDQHHEAALAKLFPKK